MSVKSAPYYWVECDDCHVKASEGNEVEAWRQDWAALEDAENADFRVFLVDGSPDLHYCIDCAEKRGLFDEEED